MLVPVLGTGRDVERLGAVKPPTFHREKVDGRQVRKQTRQDVSLGL